MRFANILAPMDGSEQSRHAFRYVLGLAESQGARVTLLHCYGPISMLVGGAAREELAARSVREAEDLLAPYADKLRALGHEPPLLLREGEPSEVIVAEAERGRHDLIVMGSRGRSDLAGMLMGSTAHKVLQAAPCPVLVTR